MKALVKWVGSKRRLAPHILERLPIVIDEYHEPFVGGGSIFAALWDAGYLGGCRRISLGDTNEGLIGLYRAVQGKLSMPYVAVGMETYRERYLKDPEAVFLDERRRWNEGERTPARFVFLKQTAFNGLWRENQKGEMNAPWGKYEDPKLPSEETVREWHRALRNVELRLGRWDFLEVRGRPGTLIYLDPPYVGTFNSYGADPFLFDDQVRLLCAAKRWADDGALVAYSNSQHMLPALGVVWPEAIIVYLSTSYTVVASGNAPRVEEILAVSA